LGLQLGDDPAPNTEKFTLVAQQLDIVIATANNAMKKLFEQQ